tara:strand:- start:1035 stop:1805 length:771 start_codon:yes stop_codon:yes gene_type:complete
MSTLIARNLTYSYSKKGQPVLNKVSVDIKPGTLTALVGPNGAGKSTLLRLMKGQTLPDKGEITIDGEIMDKSNCQVALMPQRSSMNWKFPITVENLVSLGKIKKTKSRTSLPFQIKDLLSRPNTWVNKCCEIEASMQRVGIASLAKRRLDSLSGGQQQRALLAKTLISSAKIFLLDEPCSALDPPARNDFLKIVRQIADSGLSVFISSHDWGSSLNAYDEVVVLDKKILASGAPNVIQERLDDICCLKDKNLCDCP